MLAILAGCGTVGKTIAARSQSTRSDVFREMPGGEMIPSDFADVVIKASIKTRLEGYYGAGSKDPAHGKEAYPFLIDIDGQAVHWKMNGERQHLPKLVERITSRDPEAGDGMKDILEKKVRLAAGMHKVFLGLPEEPYSTVADIAVTSGNAYVLEIKPKYGHKHVPTRMPTFRKGILHYDIYINGTPMAETAM